MRKTKRNIRKIVTVFDAQNQTLNMVAQIVTLCKDSLHADWTLIITGIDANIEYTIVALSHRTGQLIYHRKDHIMTPY